MVLPAEPSHVHYTGGGMRTTADEGIPWRKAMVATLTAGMTVGVFLALPWWAVVAVGVVMMVAGYLAYVLDEIERTMIPTDQVEQRKLDWLMNTELPGLPEPSWCEDCGAHQLECTCSQQPPQPPQRYQRYAFLQCYSCGERMPLTDTVAHANHRHTCGGSVHKVTGNALRPCPCEDAVTFLGVETENCALCAWPVHEH